MAGETQMTVIGNLTGDPELRYTPEGTAMVKFTVASTPRVLDRTSGEYRDGDPLFLTCTAWRELAEHIAESLTKGTRVVVTGPAAAVAVGDRRGREALRVRPGRRRGRPVAAVRARRRWRR